MKIKKEILRKEIEIIKAKRVEDRTQEDHIKLVKAFGGVRNYLLSMGPFIEEAFNEVEEERKRLPPLEEMMKKDGWKAGYSTNWGVRYFSFRKNGFEIDWKDINNVVPEKPSKHFSP